MRLQSVNECREIGWFVRRLFNDGVLTVSHSVTFDMRLNETRS
jgi:hypothetical protein